MNSEDGARLKGVGVGQKTKGGQGDLAIWQHQTQSRTGEGDTINQSINQSSSLEVREMVTHLIEPPTGKGGSRLPQCNAVLCNLRFRGAGRLKGTPLRQPFATWKKKGGGERESARQKGGDPSPPS